MRNTNTDNIVNKIYNNKSYTINNNIIRNIVEHIYNTNMNLIDYNKLNITKKKYICVVTDDENSSSMYINSIVKTFTTVFGYNPILIYRLTKKINAIELINKMNNDDSVVGIILTQPYFNRNDKYYFNLINRDKNIDMLGLDDYTDFDTLPTTSYIINEMIMYICMILNVSHLNITLIGNGLTVNGALNKYLVNENRHNITLVDRDTINNEELYKLIIKDSDLIVSATGQGELLNLNEFKGKIILSPTITKVDNEYVSDVSRNIRDYLITNDVKGSIGKLVITELMKRFLKKCLTKRESCDIINYKI